MGFLSFLLHSTCNLFHLIDVPANFKIFVSLQDFIFDLKCFLFCFKSKRGGCIVLWYNIQLVIFKCHIFTSFSIQRQIAGNLINQIAFIRSNCNAGLCLFTVEFCMAIIRNLTDIQSQIPCFFSNCIQFFF